LYKLNLNILNRNTLCRNWICIPYSRRMFR